MTADNHISSEMISMVRSAVNELHPLNENDFNQRVPIQGSDMSVQINSEKITNEIIQNIR